MVAIRCPSCGKTHQAPESIMGRRVQCKGCGTAFVAKQATPVNPQPVASGVPQETRARGVQPPPTGTSPDEVLRQYRATSRPVGGGATGRAAGVFWRLKARARGMRLNRELGGLRTAMEGQWEALGMLMLQHRPAGADVSEELAQLSRLQEDISTKQATLGALRQTRGSAPAAKEIERKLCVLGDRQRQVMIGVGQKAESASADAPGATGHYSALSRLRTTLQAKEAESAGIEAMVGSVVGVPFFDSSGRFASSALFGIAFLCFFLTFWVYSGRRSGGDWIRVMGYSGFAVVFDIEPSDEMARCVVRAYKRMGLPFMDQIGDAEMRERVTRNFQDLRIELATSPEYRRARVMETWLVRIPGVLALLAAVVGIGVGLAKSRPGLLLTAVCAGAGVVFMIVLRVGLGALTDEVEHVQRASPQRMFEIRMFEIGTDFGMGAWLVIVLLLAAFGLCVVSLVQSKHSPASVRV